MFDAGIPDASQVEALLFGVGDSWSRSLLHDAPLGVALKSLDGRYIWANSSAERMLGHSLAALRGKTDQALFVPAVSVPLQRSDELALAGRGGVADELEIGARGPVVACLIYKTPLAASDGRVTALAMFMVERSTAREELAALREGVSKLEHENHELRRMLDEMGRLATTDKLTAAWNRRRLDEAIGDEINRLERYGHPVSMLVLDIDFFKRVNDLHGHVAGDSVLASLSSLLRSSFRRSDSLTRWGGEEFIVLCPNTGLSMATLLAERLRESIAVAQFPPVERVTVSIGVAECIAGEKWEQWFGRADGALLLAKRQGRNRVGSAPETMCAAWAVSPVAGRLLQLTWRNAYTSGHPLIDEQHRMLFEQSNQLLAAVLDGLPDKQVEGSFESLIAGVHDHFRDEEAILGRAGYPRLRDHSVVHQELLQSAGALLDKFKEGRLGMGELFEFLARDVVAKHLLGADREFFPYLGDASSSLVERRAQHRR